MSADKYQCTRRCRGVRHSNMHYMPIHTKLCVNMRITRNGTPQNRCILSSTSKAAHLILNNSVTVTQTHSKFGREVAISFTKIITEGQSRELIHLHGSAQGSMKQNLKSSFQRNFIQMVHISTNCCITELQTTVINKLTSVLILFLQFGHRALAK